MSSSNLITIPDEFQEISSICAATDVVIGGSTVLGIKDARQLHAGLGVGKDYTTWIKGRIAKYGFRESVDFETISAKESCSPDLGSKIVTHGGHNSATYRLTIDMAKELAMVENNEVGRLIRRYFIWAEQQAREMDSLLSPAQVLSLIELVGQQREALSELSERVNNLMLSASGRVAALEYVSVRELLNEAGAVQKGRRSLNARIGRQLRDAAALSHPPVGARKCPHSGVWLFPRDFAASYMQTRGGTLVQIHNARAVGKGASKQGVLQLVPDDGKAH